MPLAEARALLERRRPAQFLRHDWQADRAELQKLAGWCRQYSPVVGLEEGEAPECLLLDITGCAHLFGGEEGLIKRVYGDFRRRELFPRIAVADTVGAAWAAAHCSGVRDQEPTSSADLSPHSGQGSGGGLQPSTCNLQPSTFIVPLGGQEEFLRPLPVEGLRLPADVVSTLHDLGVGRIEQLLALPRAALPSRFGPEVVRRLDEALGRQVEPITPCRPSRPLEACRSFEHPIEDRRLLETALRQLTEQIVQRLALQQKGVQQLEVSLRHPAARSPGVERPGAQRSGAPGNPQAEKERRREGEKGRGTDGWGRAAGQPPGQPETHFTVGLVRPSLRVSHLLELIRVRLECFARREPPVYSPGAQYRGERGAQYAANRIHRVLDVESVRLRVTATAPLEVRQGELFQNDARDAADRELHLLLDRLTSRLGPKAVLRPQGNADHQPEQAVSFHPASGRRKLPGTYPEAGASGSPGAHLGACAEHAPLDTPRSTFHGAQPVGFRPLLLKASPRRIDVTSVAPGGPPDNALCNSSPPGLSRWANDYARPAFVVQSHETHCDHLSGGGRLGGGAQCAAHLGGAPVRFRWRNRDYDVARSWGPERIETGWWRPRPVRRDYYRVETSGGRQFWLFRRLDRGDWFLHGVFE